MKNAKKLLNNLVLKLNQIKYSCLKWKEAENKREEEEKQRKKETKKETNKKEKKESKDRGPMGCSLVLENKKLAKKIATNKTVVQEEFIFSPSIFQIYEFQCNEPEPLKPRFEISPCVRITADRKVQYTLLLEFPFFINLKQKLAVSKRVNVSKIGFSQALISRRNNQPIHLDYKVACTCTYSLVCNAFYQFLRLKL